MAQQNAPMYPGDPGGSGNLGLGGLLQPIISGSAKGPGGPSYEQLLEYGFGDWVSPEPRSNNYSAYLLAGFSTGLEGNHCSHSTLESNAALSKWLLLQLRDLTETVSEFYSVQVLVNQMFSLSTDQFPRSLQTQSSAYGSKCLNQNIASLWASAQFLEGLTINHTTFWKG